MGAGQIGGIASLLDIDFNNAAGFVGKNSDINEAQHVVYFLSHTLLFCTGALIEAHVVITPAICVFSEKYKFDVYAGSHQFIENKGSSRTVDNLCIHRGFNKSSCFESDNIALLVLRKQYSLNDREPYTDFTINRIRYGGSRTLEQGKPSNQCSLFGWGSRRNGYLVPLLIHLRKVDLMLLPSEKCDKMWNYGNKYLCVQQPRCKTVRYGALCPDDMGSVLVCSGFAQGMMVSRLMDRPCGIGFLDLSKYSKFLTCGVDDSRDVIDRVDMELEFEHFHGSGLTTPVLQVAEAPPKKVDFEASTVQKRKRKRIRAGDGNDDT